MKTSFALSRTHVDNASSCVVRLTYYWTVTYIMGCLHKSWIHGLHETLHRLYFARTVSALVVVWVTVIVHCRWLTGLNGVVLDGLFHFYNIVSRDYTTLQYMKKYSGYCTIQDHWCSCIYNTCQNWLGHTIRSWPYIHEFWPSISLFYIWGCHCSTAPMDWPNPI